MGGILKDGILHNEYFSGEINNFKFHGKGILKEFPSDGELIVYKGMFVGGKKSGFGQQAWYRKDTCYKFFQGEWYEDQWSGTGRLDDKDKTYEGSWKSGRISGNVLITFLSTGYFNEKVEYYGTVTYCSKTSDYYYHGRGILTYSGNEQLVGNWCNGSIESGSGILKLSESETKYKIQKGTWENFQLTGNGYYETQCEKYTGDFLDGNYHGQGRLESSIDECVYTGSFEKGYKHGYGKITLKNGQSLRHRWEKNRILTDNETIQILSGNEISDVFTAVSPCSEISRPDFSTFRSFGEKLDLQHHLRVLNREQVTQQNLIAHGAQGIVWLSQWTHNSKVLKVAEKVSYFPRSKDEDQVAQIRMNQESEIKAMVKLQHDNIVPLYGVIWEKFSYSLIQEYAFYGSLDKFFGHPECSNLLDGDFTNSMNMAKHISNGLAYLHSQQIIHKDLKSPNILIFENLVTKIGDFGCVDSRKWINESDFVIGTSKWMAPELMFSDCKKENAEEKLDIYSLGIIFWEILSRKTPFSCYHLEF